jgi:hypothetical protein
MNCSESAVVKTEACTEAKVKTTIAETFTADFLVYPPYKV